MLRRYNEDMCFANERLNEFVASFLPPGQLNGIVTGLPSYCGFAANLGGAAATMMMTGDATAATNVMMPAAAPPPPSSA